MRNLILAFIFGSMFAMALLLGEEALRNGEQWWPLWLIVFPLVHLGGMAALLREHWKRTRPRGGRSGEDPLPSSD